MNKKETAAMLGVSVRQVEKYATEGRLGEVRYVRGKTGKQADFDGEAVARLKAELESPDLPVTALQPQAPNSPEARLFGAWLERLATTLEARLLPLAQSPAKHSLTLSDIAHKPLLTITEAQALTGLSRAVLRAAIATNELKAKRIGRADRIKRADLDAYLDKL